MYSVGFLADRNLLSAQNYGFLLYLFDAWKYSSSSSKVYPHCKLWKEDGREETFKRCYFEIDWPSIVFKHQRIVYSVCKLVFWINYYFDSSLHHLFLAFWKTFESKSFFSFLFCIIWLGSLEFFLAAWQILTQLPFQKIHPCWNLLLRHSSSAPCTCGCLYILLIKECSFPSTYQMFYFYIMCLLTPRLLFWTGEGRTTVE